MRGSSSAKGASDNDRPRTDELFSLQLALVVLIIAFGPGIVAQVSTWGSVNESWTMPTARCGVPRVRLLRLFAQPVDR